MAKITTAKIKEALMAKIGNYNWSRITKRKFEYKNNVIIFNSGRKVKLDGKLNWRVYIGMDLVEPPQVSKNNNKITSIQMNLPEPVYVIDDGESILYMASEKPQLPPSCFKFNISYSDEYQAYKIFILLKDKYQDAFSELTNIEEEIRSYTVAGLDNMFAEQDIMLTNEQENLFFATKKNGMTVQRYMNELSKNGMADFALENTEENKEFIKAILIDSGMSVDVNLVF